ncbi:MAG: hypothetical protein ACK4NW_07355 [Roseinatronobacter sp.]
MEIALHLGAHLTDETQLRDCLLQNSDRLSGHGILVPRARDYLNLIIEAANHISSGHGAPGIFERLMVSVNATDDTRRLVLSAPGLLAKLPESLSETEFYPGVERRVKALRHIFSGHDVTLYLAIRNPASFVPAYLGAGRVQSKGADDLVVQAEQLRWSDLVATLHRHWPEARLTIWCDEDTPFIWHRVLRLVAGHEPEDEFAHSFDWFNSVLREGAAEKLADYLDAAPPVDEAHRQQVIAAFLDKFSDAEKLEIDASVTGWDEDRIDLLSELYEDDTDTIRAMPGVTFLEP